MKPQKIKVAFIKLLLKPTEKLKNAIKNSIVHTIPMVAFSAVIC